MVMTILWLRRERDALMQNNLRININVLYQVRFSLWLHPLSFFNWVELHNFEMLHFGVCYVNQIILFNLNTLLKKLDRHQRSKKYSNIFLRE